MSQTPPPYANYPRNTPTYGSARQLQSLADGYFGLSKVFYINIALVLGWRLLAFAVPALALPFALVVGIAVGMLSFPQNQKIGVGANWSSTQPVVASVLMGINSALCCGIIGYAVMQSIATNHMKRYGIKGGLFGLKKSDVNQFIRDLEAREANGPQYG